MIKQIMYLAFDLFRLFLKIFSHVIEYSSTEF